MITLDQVLFLEQKVENAVAKIEQLNAENAALRRKCVELTNALSAQTEQFSSFQSDQNKIEEGILKALEKLNSIENEVYQAAEDSGSVQNRNTAVSDKQNETTTVPVGSSAEKVPSQDAYIEEQNTAQEQSDSPVYSQTPAAQQEFSSDDSFTENSSINEISDEEEKSLFDDGLELEEEDSPGAQESDSPDGQGLFEIF